MSKIIMNPDFDELEKARLEATKLCEEANDLLKSITPEEFRNACDARECALVFDGFEASTQSKKIIGNQIVELMVGAKAQKTIEAGNLGSMWFDVEIADPEFNFQKRLIRVALVPKSYHLRFGGEYKFCFAILDPLR
jgi:regulator of RNase E activity RraB